MAQTPNRTMERNNKEERQSFRLWGLGLNMKGTAIIMVLVLAVGTLTVLAVMLELASLWKLRRAAPVVELETPSQTTLPVSAWNGLYPFCGQPLLWPGIWFCPYHGQRFALTLM
jgi:hypothetical protein